MGSCSAEAAQLFKASLWGTWALSVSEARVVVRGGDDVDKLLGMLLSSVTRHCYFFSLIPPIFRCFHSEEQKRIIWKKNKGIQTKDHIHVDHSYHPNKILQMSQGNCRMKVSYGSLFCTFGLFLFLFVFLIQPRMHCKKGKQFATWSRFHPRLRQHFRIQYWQDKCLIMLFAHKKPEV